MTRVLLILTIVLFAGCNPCKRLARRCPETIKIIERIERDTIRIHLPADTVTYEASIYDFFDMLGIVVDTTTKDSARMTIENDDQKISVSTNDDMITIESICLEDSLVSVIERLRRDTNRIRIVDKPVPVIRNSKYHRITGIAAPVLLLLVAFFVYIKLRL